MKYLITGGCGFLGCNLATEVLMQGEELVIFDNLYRSGTTQNLLLLRKKGDFQFVHGDIRNSNDIESAIRNIHPDVIFHLAGQVAMTTSISNPRLDFEVNVVGSFNLLEAVRKNCPDSIIIYSSTNKVYGDLEHLNYEEQEKRYVCTEYPLGFNESIPLEFHSPYGCSKGAIDQYMLDYARIFEMKTVVFRHSTIYGPQQFSTFDQGWIGWFCQKAIETKRNNLSHSFTISGNGKQVRDILFIIDAVNCYFSAVSQITEITGEVFNIGGGIENSLSILELFKILEEMLDIKLCYQNIPSRKSDQKFFVSNINKAKSRLNWQPSIRIQTGVEYMLQWLSQIYN